MFLKPYFAKVGLESFRLQPWDKRLLTTAEQINARTAEIKTALAEKRITNERYEDLIEAVASRLDALDLGGHGLQGLLNELSAQLPNMSKDECGDIKNALFQAMMILRRKRRYEERQKREAGRSFDRFKRSSERRQQVRAAGGTAAVAEDEPNDNERDSDAQAAE